MKKIFFLLAALLALSGAARAQVSVSVSGNQLHDVNGNATRLLGVNSDGGGSCNVSLFGTAPEISSWAGVNAVRMALDETCWLNINGTNAPTYRQSVIDLVNSLVAQGFYVDLSLLFSAVGSNPSTAGGLPMPESTHAPVFWADVATVFSSDHAVLFDLFNEPTTSTWSCWLNGCTEFDSTDSVSYAAVGMQSLVNTVRGTGATNVILLGGLAYSFDLSGWVANLPTDSAHQLAAAFHIYNTGCDSTCVSAQILPVQTAGYPVVIEELGEYDCIHTFVDSIMNWADAQTPPLGYMGWAWRVKDCTFPGMLTDMSGVPTAYGVGFQNHFAALGTSAPPPPSGVAGPTAAPAFSPAAGTFATTTISVTLASATKGAAIHYTTDGSTPTSGSTLYTGPISVSSTETIKAIAISAATTVNLSPANPSIAPNQTQSFIAVDDQNNQLNVTWLLWTTTDPSIAPISSNGQAVGLAPGKVTITATEPTPNSSVASGTFTIGTASQVATPAFSPAEGTYASSPLSVTISDSTGGSSIYYTLDGSTPTTSSPLYAGAISVASSETINAIATHSGDVNSAVNSAAYVINQAQTAAPTFGLAAGTYSGTQSVTLSDSTGGSSIYYTIDGSVPTPSATLYTGAISVASSTVIRAMATASGYANSLGASAAYTIALPVAPAGGVGLAIAIE